MTKLLNMLIWSLLSPGPWQIKSCWMQCKTLNLIFSKTNFGPTGVYVLSFISRTWNNFSTGLFPMYRGILELKNDTVILRKHGSFANKMCCGLTALFVKTKSYFSRCNIANKQKFLVSLFRIDCENVYSFGNGTSNQWATSKNDPA